MMPPKAPQRRARSPTPDPSSDGSSSNSSESESPAKETRPELDRLKKDELITIAAEIGAPTTGTKADLIRDITAAWALADTKTHHGPESRHDSKSHEEWAVALKRRTNIKLKEVSLSLDSAAVILSPIMWVVMVWEHPVPVEDIFGPYGTKGASDSGSIGALATAATYRFSRRDRGTLPLLRNGACHGHPLQGYP